MSKYKRGAAYHEAGHVVAAWACGVRVRKVGIGDLGGRCDGRTYLDFPRCNEGAAARILIAGALSEYHFCPGHYHDSSSCADQKQLESWGIPPLKLLQYAMQVRGILSQHGDAVHALAQRLLTEHTIIFSRRRK